MTRTGSQVLLLLSLVVVVGCGSGPTQTGAPKPVDVDVARPIKKEITDYEIFTGRTDAPESVDVRARVTGYLKRARFKDGQDVTWGAALFEIDPSTYDAELARARANLDQALAHLQRLDYDYKRGVVLRGKGAINQEELDKIIGDRAEAEAGVNVARASLRMAEQNRDWCDVTAPLGGRISRRMIDPGNLVKADDTVLTSIVSLEKMYAYFDVDERTLLRLRRLVREGKIPSGRNSQDRLRTVSIVSWAVGQAGGLPHPWQVGWTAEPLVKTIRIDMALADEEGFPHQGFFDFADNRIDPMSGTLRIRAVFDNPRSKNTPLFSPGMFVRVRLPIGAAHQATLIPERALGTDKDKKFLYVIKEKKDKDGKLIHVAERRDVEIGSLHDGLRAIEDKNFSADELFVVRGLQRISKDGMEVHFKPPESVEPLPVPNARLPLSTNKVTVSKSGNK